MGFNEINDFAASIFGIRPGTKQPGLRYPIERLDTVTGAGFAPVTCLFNVSSDGDIEDMKVMIGGVDIVKALHPDQINVLEIGCWQSYLDDAKERNAELRIESWRAARELA